MGIEFTNREEVLAWLTEFYRFYNEERLHSSICDVSPARFLLLRKHGLVGHDLKHGRLVFYLKLKRYLIAQTLHDLTFSSHKEQNSELGGAGGEQALHEVKGACSSLAPPSGHQPPEPEMIIPKPS